MKRALFFVILSIWTVSFARAQKVKYKDLYLLLEAKKYDEAEPFLRSFLKDSKNTDHANANLQMALMFQEKSYKNDVLLDDGSLRANVDSSLYYYDKALEYIDDKEVKRNDEFYRAYQRRDIRTGKFGVKLTDIQFDIEKRQQALHTRKEKVEQVSRYYKSTSEMYNKAFRMFSEIQKQYRTEKELFLQGDDELSETLGELDNVFTTVIQDFNKFKTTLGKIPQSGYDPSLQLREILDYTKDGKTPSDLTADNVDLWDFGKWAEGVRNKIKNEIYPLKESLITFNQDLDKLEKKLISDSVSITDEIKSISTIENELKDWDEKGLPINIFDLKISNLEYRSYQIEHKDYADSINITYRQQVVNESLSRLLKIDSIANSLIGRNLVDESKYYSQFIDKEFNGTDGLESYVKSQIDFSVNGRKLKELELEEIEERMKWLIDETDSIPMFFVADTTSYTFQPILIEKDLTTGLRKNADNSIEGYFTLATKERTTKTKTFFEVNEKVFNFSNLNNLKSKVLDDGEGDIYYVLLYTSELRDSSYVGCLSKIYSSDGLAWDKEVLLSALPEKIDINQGTGDISIKYNQTGSVESGTTSIDRLLIDKKGNVIK